MKKFYLLILFISTINLFTFSQIKLEHTFNGNISIFASNYTYAYDFDCFVEYDSTTIKIYNTDYTLYKTININYEDCYIGSTYHISKNLINDDNKIEIIINLTKKESFKPFYIIIDENGKEIKNFKSDTEGGQLSLIIYLINNQYKLVLREQQINNGVAEYKTHIYSTETQIISHNVEIQVADNSPYPNPSNHEINLTYQLNNDQDKSIMNIYNVSGMYIESKVITKENNQILLNVTTYPKGVYLYEVNGVSQKFIVE